MKIYTHENRKFYALTEKLDEFTPTHKGGIILSPFDELAPTVDLIGEISSPSGAVKKACALSRATGGVAIVAAKTSLYSLSHLSAIVAHEGELLEIADSCTALPPFAPSYSVKVLKSGSLKIALLVGDDAFYRPLFLKVANRCDLIVSLPVSVCSAQESLVRHYADEANKPVLLHSLACSLFITPNLN